MANSPDESGVLYEVNLDAEAGVEAAFDTWLRDHVADMLQIDGFRSAQILVDPAPPTGRIRRTVQYRLRDQAALERYLRVEAPAMRGRGVAVFGDRFSAERRVLAPREEFQRGRVSTENCLNCGEVLTGQHCAHCGQRAKVRVLSMRSLLRDLFGDLTNFDSRVWRTLRPLAFKPGWLTTEYLQGRRTRYTPPFRMYLILSVAFFIATTLGADPGGAIQFGPDGEGGANLQLGDRDAEPAASDAPASVPAATSAAEATAAGEPPAKPAATTAAPADKLDPERRRVIERIVAQVPKARQAEVRADLERELADLTPAQVAAGRRLIEDPCGEQNIRFDVPGGEQYVPRLREACRKIVADSSSFGRALYENVPKMMFVFLPLIAAVMFVLYLGSGRYYVEHLLFFVHYHAFFFLGGLTIALLDRGAGLWPETPVAGILGFVEGVLTFAFVVYLPWYLYAAMRRVYGQGRFVTLLKYSLLGVGYLFFMTLTAAALLVYTALTL